MAIAARADPGTKLALTLAVAADIEQGKRNIDEHGYTVHENYLDADQVARVKERLEEQARLELAAGVATIAKTGHADRDRGFGGSAGAAPQFQQVEFLPNKGREFLDVMNNPVALAYGAHIFRNVPFNLVTQAGTFLRKGGKRQVMHADQQALPFATPLPVMFNILLCLSDFDADMGATNVVPGSHRFGSPDLGKDPDEAAAEIGSALIPMVAKAGSALIFESRTWHCQGTATSDKVRVLVSTVYGMHFMKPQDVYPAIIHDDVYETLSETDRDMLGFRVQYEYAGRIAPRSPSDTRTNTNAHYPYIPELREGGRKRPVSLENMAVAKAEKLAEQIA